VTLRNPEVTSVSAFFPCYNDEHSIATMVRSARSALDGNVAEFEIIVVDDGSSDHSVKVLRELQLEVPELQVVIHPANRGYGGALISGFGASTKQWVFYTDGDAQYDASELVRCLDAVRPDTDVVQGWKIERGDAWYRKLIGRVYHHTVRLLFNLHVRDTDCDFRLIRGSVMEQIELTSTSGVICVEMMRKLEDANARFVEVGVSHYERPHGRSQFFRLPAIARSARQLLVLWWHVVALRSHSMPTIVTAQRVIDAPADALYAMVSDVTRMGQWSPETTSCEWLKGATGPAVGAKFKGRNSNGAKQWSTVCTVVRAEPGVAFAFRVDAGPFKVSEWAYRFEPGDGGTTVTETWTDRRAGIVKRLGKPLSGVDDRAAHNAAGMERTLEQLAAAAEHP